MFIYVFLIFRYVQIDKQMKFCLTHKNKLFFQTNFFLFHFIITKITDNCFSRGLTYYNTEKFSLTLNKCIQECECVANSRRTGTKCKKTR